MTAGLQINDARLEPAAKKVLVGERLNAEDGLALYQSHDLLDLLFQRLRLFLLGRKVALQLSRAFA